MCDTEPVNELYHLTTAAEWEHRDERGLRAPSLETEGFIHCSTISQVSGSARRFFGDTNDTVVLRIDPARVTAPIVWEDSLNHGGRFPHIYGPLNLDAVTDIVAFGPISADKAPLPSALGGDDRLERRFGVRWGLAGGVGIASVAETCRLARWADEVGFDSFWVSQSTAVDPIVALSAASAEAPGLAEVGTSIVPLYGRHPFGLAQATRTAQSAWSGRFTLGIGPSHRDTVEATLGLSWDRPFSYTQEFLDGLLPLLSGNEVEAVGSQLTTRGALAIDAPPTTILLAGLGPRMLALAGARCAGTTVGQCGPRTIEEYVAPSINAAAAEAGRSQPRVVALVRVCVTDGSTAQNDKARALAREVAAFYEALPSYAAVIAREGVAEASELFLIGTASEVTDGLAAYAAAGATDLRVEVSAPDEAMAAATRDALVAQLN